MYLLGLDVGTSGCKGLLINRDGEIKGTSYEEYSIENPKKGYYEINPLSIWNTVQKVIYQTTLHHKDAEIKALSVSSFGESAVPMSSDGIELSNIILYMDRRGTDQANYLKKQIGAEKIMELTGHPVHSMYTINKIGWIKENQPELFKKTWKFMLVGDYITYKLTGIDAIGYSLAARTMAFNPIKKQWESQIFEELGIENGNDLFSRLVPSGTAIGTVKKELSYHLGLSLDTQVVIGGHDQSCAALGAGVVEDGFAVDSIGTVECITPSYSKPLLNKGMLDSNFNCSPHVVEDCYLTFALNMTGGSTLKWYRDCFMEHLKKDASNRGVSVYEILDENIHQEPTNLLVFPHFAGAGKTHMDSSYKGAIMGLTLETTAVEVYRAFLEGLNYEMLYNLEYLADCGIEVNILRAVGGGAKSKPWMQIKADILGRQIEMLENNEAGALGAAILAGTGTGEFVSLQEAAKNLVKINNIFTPNDKNKEVYQENYERYKELYKVIGKF